MTDEHSELVVGEQTAVLGVRGGRQTRRGGEVRRDGEEPQAPRLQAESLEERPQLRLVAGAYAAYGHRRAVA